MGNHSNNYWRARKGFTIVELLIVIVVIAILAAVSLVSYQGITTRVVDTSVKSAATQASKEISVYSVTANPNPYPTTDAAIKACQSSSVNCIYTRTDYTEVESGDFFWGYALVLCDKNGLVHYSLSNMQPAPRKVENSFELTPKIDNQYNLFTSPSMSVWNTGAPGGQYGTIYGYTGQTVSMSVSLRKCTPANKVTYQWQSRPDINAAWSNISGATSSSYVTPILNSTYDGRYYRVVLTNQYGSTYSGHGGMIIDFEP